jgi:hypothetical protein
LQRRSPEVSEGKARADLEEPMNTYRVVLADDPHNDFLTDKFVGIIVHADSESVALNLAEVLFPNAIWLYAKLEH